MYAIALLQGMVFYAPVAALYRRAAGVSVFEISLIEAVSLALCVALEAPWGALAERLGYRRTLVLCCGLYFISKLVFWRADSFGDFLTERILLAVVQAGLSGVDSALLYLSCRGENSLRVFSVYNTLTMAGLVAAGGVFALLPDGSYRLSALLTAGSYGAAFLCALGLREVRNPDPAPARGSFAAAARQALGGGILPLLAGAALLTEVCQVATVFLNQLKYEACGLGPRAMGAAYVAAALLGLAGAFSPALARRLGTRGAAAFCALVCLAGCGALAVTAAAPAAVASVLALRTAGSLLAPLTDEERNRRLHTKNRASALSVQAMAMECFAMAVNLALGALAQRSLPAAFVLGALLSAAGLGLLLVRRKA